MPHLYAHSLLDARQLLASGNIRPTELVASCLARIKATEPLIHACTYINEQSALEKAAELEKQGYTADQALWGIPISIKDNICTAHMPTTCSSNMLQGFIPPYTAFAVEQLEKAGAIILSKNNLDEFAMGSSTATSATGASANPWDITAVPGGSSGGSAAGVTACQTFASLGTDSGGSIRQPAALCGCVGFKPTYGRVSRYGAVAYASSFDQIGPLARTVADCATIFSVIAAYDSQDASCADLPPPSIAESLTCTNLSGMTLGYVRELWEADIAPEVYKNCQEAVERAKDLGATIIDITLPSLRYSAAAYTILSCAEASTSLARFDGVRFGSRGKTTPTNLTEMYTTVRSTGFADEVKRRILLGTYVLSAEGHEQYFQQAAKVRRMIRDEYTTALQQCHALIAPSSPCTAWKNTPQAMQEPSAQKDALLLGVNLAGLPGLSLPAGLGGESGLPVGLHLVGRAFDEATLLAIAHALEGALPQLPVPSGLSHL